MQDILGASLRRLKRIRVRKMRMVSILLVLSLVVSLDVFWLLRQPGLTLAGDADCGMLEHTHDEACQEEGKICDFDEHVHSIECYSDETADVETPLDWQNMFADYPYTGTLREDLVGIAKTQVGYAESALNFEIGDDGVRRGYTRYGAWYGTPYRDWSAMFVSFCLHFAGADPEETPGNTGAAAMMEIWRKLGKFASAEAYLPVSGDLVFFTDNTAGIVAQVQSATIYVIRGDVEDAVCRDVLSLNDETIAGWGLTERAASDEETVSDEETASGEETTPDKETTSDEESGSEEENVTDEEIITENSTQTEPDGTAEEIKEIDLWDISNGPAVFIFAGETAQPQMQRFTTRAVRAVTELIPYLEAKGGSYFFTLLDSNNQELPKDANGNYVVQADTGYKLTISFSSPEGFHQGTYQYQIPNGLMVDGGEGSFVLEDGVNVGSWVVTDEGLITFVFNENANSRTDVTISATMGIRFPEEEEPIDFDGKIIVTVEKPPQQQDPTALYKWGVQGNADDGKDSKKLYWTVQIVGNKDSQIPGSILTDEVVFGEWSKEHRYTASDIAGGLTFGVSEPNPETGGEAAWHSWHVSPDDPNLTWTETGWSYRIPETVTCQWCGELTLGNENWMYTVNYTSTPDPTGTAGTYGYENKVEVDRQKTYAWADFVQGELLGEVAKYGSFHGDAGGGSFLWELQATVPGIKEGQKADYYWFIMDYMDLRDGEGGLMKYITNDVDNAMVTATRNGTTILVPHIHNATANDPFAWHDYWSADHNDGIYYGRQLNLLCRCNCTAETCPHWTNGRCGSEYWFVGADGIWQSNGYCLCWAVEGPTTFTFTYETDDLTIVEEYGGNGNRLRNEAVLYNKPPYDETASIVVSRAQADVTVPGVFKKELTHDFNGYTANYKVTVNEAKMVLTNGSPLYIHDEMTQTLAYISGSLVITTEDANGNTATLQQGKDYTVTYDGTGNATDEQGKPVHVLDIVILQPQPVMYILDYDTTLIIPHNTSQAVKYSNSATITLWGEDMTDTSVEKVYADINIAAKSYNVELFKTDALTGEPLGGATFGLYNAQGGLISTDITDADGEILFQTNIIEGIILREHVLYYMQELKAPPGYQLDDTKHWFCFCDKKTDTCATCTQIMADTDAVRIPYERIGTVRAVNDRISYNLPETGGPGVYPVILASVVLIVTPLVYGFILRRKRERRGAG